MKISKIELFQHDLELTQNYTMAGVCLSSLDSTIVKISTDNGHVGWGESCPVGPTYQPEHARGTRAATQQISPALIGQTVLNTNSIKSTMEAQLNGHSPAKAAIDMAIMDLAGKYYKRPVCDLLGGALLNRVPSYYAIGIESADETARIARDKITSGFKRLQLKCGGRAIEEDIEVIRKVAESISNATPNSIQLVADANRSLTARDTLLLSQACSDIKLVLEQPCNTMAEIASIKNQLRHPVYLDENIETINHLLEAISQNLCEGFGFKTTRLGGLNSMATIRDICAARSLPHTCDDSFGGDICAAACVHIAATVQPKLLDGVWIAAPYIKQHYDSDNPVDVVNGFIDVPSGFGLGINPDESLFGDVIWSSQ